MTTEYRMAFYHKEKRLHSYPMHYQAEEAPQAILDTLAHQHGCAPEDIAVFMEECAPKQWDFARDCSAERIDDQGGEERWRILNVTNGQLHTHKGSLDSFIAKYEAGEA